LAEVKSSGAAFGRYQLLEQLGEGGMGVVYRAAVEDTKGVVRQCVIKRIRPPLAQNQAFIDALVQEARLCAQLHHPGIVQLLELGTVGTEYYLALQWLDGVDLRRLMKHCRALERPIPPGLASFIASEVASALAYAHALRDERGRPLDIIHRDVSPANIFVTRPGRVMLLDFGIARAASHLSDARTGTGILKGTLGYMSPEQAAAQPLDGRSDLFSLGVVLHECLTGKPLFRAANPLELLRQICETDAPPPSSVRPELDDELDRIVAKALPRNRSQRYAKADDLARALRPIVLRYQTDAGALSDFLVELGLIRDVAGDGDAAAIGSGHPAHAEDTDALEAIQSGAPKPPARLPISSGSIALGESWARLRAHASARPWRFAALPVAAGAGAALGISAVALHRFYHPTQLPGVGAGAALPARRTLAIFGFRNISGLAKDAWLATGLKEMLGSELRAGKQLRTLSGNDVARMEKELGLADSDPMSTDVMARVQKDLQVSLVLRGSYTIVDDPGGGQLRLDLQVQDCGSGEVVSSVSESGPKSASSRWWLAPAGGCASSSCPTSARERTPPTRAPRCPTASMRHASTPPVWPSCAPATPWARATGWQQRWRPTTGTRSHTWRWRRRGTTSATIRRPRRRRSGRWRWRLR
jgi:serine/threonine protein kinase